MSANHSNSQNLENLVQYVFLLSIIFLLSLCTYYGINCFPSLYDEKIFSFFKNAFFPLEKEIVVKVALLVVIIGYLLTRSLKKKEDIQPAKHIIPPVFFGLFFYFIPIFIFRYSSFSPFLKSLVYISFTLIGYYLLLKGLSNLQKIIHFKSKFSQFDKENKTFPMETRLIETKYSVNVKCENSYVNITNHFAGVNILGNPGTGKTYIWVYESIIQLLQKGFTACIYDFKEGEMSTFAWNVFNVHYKEISKLIPGITFNVFNPNEPINSVRINPIAPSIMPTAEHCIDAATTFYYNLIPGASDKKGDIYFPESGRAYMCSLFLFLRFSALKSKLNDQGVAEEGNCCTLAHVIALGSYMNEATGKGQDELYEVMAKKKETSGMFRSAFGDAIQNKAGKQLAGQISSGKLPLSFLNSANLFWCLTGDDVTLDVNNPAKPQILCLRNAGEMLAEMYSPILGLLIGQVMKLINSNNKLPCLLSVDEAYTIYLRNIDKLIATARSRLISTWLIMQDYEMLTEAYKKERAEIIKNITATKIAGRVSGGTAEYFEKLFGKTLHDRISTTITKQDVQHSKSQQLEFLLPSAEISDMQNREFAGIVADDAGTKNPLKYRKFRDVPIIDAKEREKYYKLSLPQYIEGVTKEELQPIINANYDKVHLEIKQLITQEYNRIQMGGVL